MILRAFQARPNSPPALCRREYPLELRWSKRMINVLIVVLRAIVAVSNAMIAVLELIRQFID